MGRAASDNPAFRAADAVGGLDWARLLAELDRDGLARAPAVLPAAECKRLSSSYEREELFRKRVDMERHRFGVGDYAYFAEPPPEPVPSLRRALYRRLAPLANAWMERLRLDRRYPGGWETFRRECRRAGQVEGTPLLLRYGPGGYNCLHRDVYGEVAFPFQAAFLLSRPGSDFDGGELLLVEQRPRSQSVGHALALARGEMVVFANGERPIEGARGVYRAVMRHGVSRVRRGRRFTLGIIFHQAAS